MDFRKLWHPNDVSIADINKIEKTIEKIPSGSVVRLGGMTDCFQPMEQKIENTYKTIKMLNKKGIHYLIVTKSSLVATSKYRKILNPRLAHIQVSVPSTDNKVLNDTDNAPSYENRVKAIETLYSKGYDVSIRLSPFLYETVDYDKVNSINVDKCLVEFLRITPQLKEALKDYINFEDYSVKEGGYRHLPLEKKLEVLEPLEFKEITICDDVQDHYEYFKKNFNHNPNDCCNLTL